MKIHNKLGQALRLDVRRPDGDLVALTSNEVPAQGNVVASEVAEMLLEPVGGLVLVTESQVWIDGKKVGDAENVPPDNGNHGGVGVAAHTEDDGTDADTTVKGMKLRQTLKYRLQNPSGEVVGGDNWLEDSKDSLNVLEAWIRREDGHLVVDLRRGPDS